MRFTWLRIRVAIAVLCVVALSAGCAQQEKKDRDFHTSGSREADQRAEQRVVKDQQLKDGSGKSGTAGSGEKKQSLYDRLGGEEKLVAIVDDFVTRALADPRVNWERKGVDNGGFFRSKPMEWNANPANVAEVKKHIVQFLSLATGGPVHYDGKDMSDAHKGMQITNVEFDAALGDLKATLDTMQIPTQEQKELLAIVESTRPQIAEKRE